MLFRSMPQVTLDRKCLGPFGRNPKKSQDERRRELARLSKSKKGQDTIRCLWAEIVGINPANVTITTSDVIATILAAEYPDEP